MPLEKLVCTTFRSLVNAPLWASMAGLITISLFASRETGRTNIGSTITTTKTSRSDHPISECANSGSGMAPLTAQTAFQFGARHQATDEVKRHRHHCATFL